MNTRNLIPLAGLLLTVFGWQAASAATQIIGDTYDVTGSGSGFTLGSGLNSGINPPTTRLTGTAKEGLRYIKVAGSRADTTFTVTGGKFDVVRDASQTATVALSTGTSAFDFSSALGTLGASPTDKASYDITIKMTNRGTGAGTARFSFAFGSQSGTAGAWDFGIQVYRVNATDTFYTLAKRISTGASGLGAALNSTITTTAPGTWSGELSFLIRVTDAGAETASFSSQIQVSMDGGTTWFYDSSTDPDLTNGWRLSGAGRYIMWDIAGTSATYDDFSVTWNSGPPLPPPGTPRTWTGAGADDAWSTGANWGGVAPTNGDMLIFNGTARQTNTNDISGLTVPWLAFNNAEFALYGNAFTNSGIVTNLAGTNIIGADMAWSSTSGKTWSLASDSELQLNNTTTVEVNGDHTLVGGGALRLKGTMNIGQATTANPAFVVNEGQHIVDGGTFMSRGGYRIGSLGTATAGAQTIISNGATFALTVSGANLRVGDSSNAVTSRLVVDNSTLTMTGGRLYLPYAAGATGEVSQVGGTVSGCRLSFSYAGVGQCYYYIKDGTLEAYQIEEVTSGGNSRMYFSNAVLRALSGATNAFMSGLNRAEIQAGGLRIDAQADVVIAQKLLGAGALTKSGPSALTLTGANTYTGDTLVNEGKLVLPTGQNCAAIQVADYAELGVWLQAAGSSLTNGTLNLASGGVCTLSFDLGTGSNPTVPLLTVTNLTANGVVSINVANGLQLRTGTIVLVDYQGAIGGGGFDAFVLNNLPTGMSAELVNNIANSSIDLHVSGVPGFLWTGAVSWDWDGGTLNWLDQQGGLPSVYLDGFVTEFRDGAATGVVNVASYPMPLAIIVSNTALPYVWIGGAITTPILKKYGPGSATRMDGEADLINGIELNEGSYAVSNLYDATFATVLSDTSAGAGTFVKQGPSTLTVTSTNSTYDGAVLVQEGILKVGTDRALGATSGSTTIADGATLDLNHFTPGFEPVFVSGSGVNDQGAIIDTTTSGAVMTSLRNVTMLGDTTFGAPNGGRWDIRVRSGTGAGPGLQGNGHTLTKVGSGFVSIACQRNLGAATPYWQMDLGDILISEGTLAFAESLDLGSASASLTVSPGAKLQLYDLGVTNPITRTIVMSDAQITASGADTHTNILNGPVQLAGADSIFCDQAHLIINGPIGGSGSITFGANNPGTLILNGVNTYGGDTIVTNGTLGGYGIIPHNLVMLGGTNSPGWEGLGTLTVNGSVTLAGTTLMELDRSRSPDSDRLAAAGALAFGGILQGVLAAGAPAPQAGDVYQLFNKGSGSGFAAISLPSLAGLPGDLAWDTSMLSINGTISVTGTPPPPSIGTVSLSGNTFMLSGTGGVEGNSYHIVSSPDVATALASWMTVASNVFGPGGSFSYSTNIASGGPRAFFRLVTP